MDNDNFSINIAENDNPRKSNPKKSIDENDNPHKSNPIGMMEISPNGKYLVTYSEKDETIVGWNVEGIENKEVKVPKGNQERKRIFHMSVSDEKKLAYINRRHEISMYNDYL